MTNANRFTLFAISSLEKTIFTRELISNRANRAAELVSLRELVAIYVDLDSRPAPYMFLISLL